MATGSGEEPSAVLTRATFERLRAELDDLKARGRSETAERLRHARELGDIRENAEYSAAKDDQGLMEARIRELERLLKHPQIAEGPASAEQAGPGTLVTVLPVDDPQPDEETYLLVLSKEERAAGIRTVTTSSPLGQALLGKRVGERLSYEAPGGTFSFEVLRVEKPEA
ncbi:MAG: GreA/GreB family elongation factor [Actinomycetota bacterium]